LRFPFRKLHGLGNDFIVVDCRADAELAHSLSQPQLARILCDRRRGIGGDGILPILPAPPDSGAYATMVVVNSDGSQAEMCGNGIRCVAKYLGDEDPSLQDETALEIHTAAGTLNCELTRETGLVTQVKVQMGAPKMERELIPMTGAGWFIEQPLEANGRPFSFTAVGMGNPHLIAFVGDGENLRNLACTYGPAFENHPAMPNRTNVEFAAVRDKGDIDVWVWERGSGLTQACGTGACATLVAAVLTDRAQFNTPTPVHLPGGPLTIEVLPEYGAVWMTGPACDVFSGEWNGHQSVVAR
jgi:diaminopimelate epimerase